MLKNINKIFIVKTKKILKKSGIVCIYLTNCKFIKLLSAVIYICDIDGQLVKDAGVPYLRWH